MMSRPTYKAFAAALLLLILTPTIRANAAQTQAWIEILQSDAPLAAKAQACQRLGEFGTPAAVPVLAGLLDHDVLATYARAGLERIPGPEGVAALRAALAQTGGMARIGVIHSLAALRDERCVPTLSTLAGDSDPETARAALLALGRIANDMAVSRVRHALSQGPAASRPDAAAACLLAAEQELKQGRYRSAAALYDSVRQADVPASYRIGATRGAILARQTDRIPFLVQQLRSPDRAIREVAVLTIREHPQDAFAAVLNTEIERASPEFQIHLIGALQDCYNTKSFPILQAKVASENAAIRMAALRVLRNTGGPDSAPALIGVLRAQRSPEEQSLAARRLEEMKDSQVNVLILQALASATESEFRVQLIRLLEKRAALEARDALLDLAADEDAEVRIASFQALKSLAGIDELSRLLDLTKACRDEAEREAAASAVAGAARNSAQVHRAGGLVLQELKSASGSIEQEVWIRVLALLGYAEALPTVAAILQTAEPGLAQSIVAHMGRWPDPAPIETLFQVVEGNAPAGLRRRARIAVLQLATRAADQNQAADVTLVSWFRRAGKSVQSVAEKRLLISGLGRVKHIDSVQMLAHYLDDPDVQTEAAYALVSAAEPLVQGPDARAVAAILPRMANIQDPRLQERVKALQRDLRIEDPPQASRPNILWLSAEDISPHLGCYGDPHAITPNLDRLAAAGERYTHAFTTAGVCAPCRSGIITGMYQTSIGGHHMRCVTRVPDFIKPFPVYLRQAGYYCANNSKQDYQFSTPKETWDASDSRAHWRKRPDKNQPFFAVFNFTGCHESGIAGEKKYRDVTAKLTPAQRQDPQALTTFPPYYPDTPVAREDWKRNYELITALDAWAGDLIDQLRADGLYENTVIFFWSDHGVGLPRAKRWLYDSGTRIPLIVYVPEGYRQPDQGRPGTVTDRLVSSIDFGPTVLNLAGLAVPPHMQGLPFLGAKRAAPREFVYGARDRMDERYDIIRMVRDRRFQYIRNYEPLKTFYQYMNTPEQGATMRELRRLHASGQLNPVADQFFAPTKPVEELYDTVDDPHEIHNLAGDPRFAADLKRLREAHLTWVKETRDLGLIPEPILLEKQAVLGHQYGILREPGSEATADRIADISALASEPQADLDALQAALGDPEPSVRYWAATGLGNRTPDSRRLASAVRPLLQDASAVNRVAAARALCRMGQPDEALPVLVHVLENGAQWERLQAAIVLDEIDEQARPVIPALRRALKPRPDLYAKGKYVVRVINRALNQLENTNNTVP
jgi:uncharacterized sulfatase